MLLVPPSRSLAPGSDPAAAPVTRAPSPPAAASWRAVPDQEVGCGVPRSHAPDVAVSVPSGSVVQPCPDSKPSENTVAGSPPPPSGQFCSPLCCGTLIALQAAFTASHSVAEPGNSSIAALIVSTRALAWLQFVTLRFRPP